MSASPAAGGGLRPAGAPCPAATPRPPSAPPGAAAPGKGSGLPSAPGAALVDAGARRCPHCPPPVPPRSPLSRAISGAAALPPSLSAGASLGSAAERRSVPAAGESGWPPCAGRGCAGRERSGDGERRALPPRPLAHLQAPHAGGAGAGGRAAGAALPRGRGISGQGPAGALGRVLGRCRPRLWGSCRSPRGWLYKYVCRCLSWGSVAGFCARGSGESVWKARPSGAFRRTDFGAAVRQPSV